jgi:hypothetical protein
VPAAAASRSRFRVGRLAWCRQAAGRHPWAGR